MNRFDIQAKFLFYVKSFRRTIFQIIQNTHKLNLSFHIKSLYIVKNNTVELVIFEKNSSKCTENILLV
jgi:hypothetical protein